MTTKQRYHFIVPQGLHKKTRRYMLNLIRRLDGEDIITSLDEGALSLLMSAYETWVQASELLKNEGYKVTDKNAAGTVVTKQHPAVNIQKFAAQELAKLFSQFGLTPAARKKMGKTDMGDDSPLDQFLKQNKE